MSDRVKLSTNVATMIDLCRNSSLYIQIWIIGVPQLSQFLSEARPRCVWHSAWSDVWTRDPHPYSSQAWPPAVAWLWVASPGTWGGSLHARKVGFTRPPRFCWITRGGSPVGLSHEWPGDALSLARFAFVGRPLNLPSCHVYLTML